MAVAKYVFRQPDPFEYTKSINYSIFYEFFRRKLSGEQEGDLFTKKRITYQSFGGEVVVEAKGKFVKNQPSNSWSKPSHDGTVKKITYKYTDPVTGLVSTAKFTKINLTIDQITSGNEDDFAEQTFARNDKVKMKGLLDKLEVEKTGFDALDSQAVRRGLVIFPFKFYDGDDIISVSGNLKVNIYGGNGSDEYVNIITKKASVFPEITVMDAEAGESMRLKGLNGGWNQYGGSETAWSVYKENNVTNSGRMAAITGATINQFDIY